MPFSVRGLVASNSAANEWCAYVTPPASSSPAAIRTPTIRTFIFSSVSGPVVLAQVPGHLFARHPPKVPGALPRARVGAGILDRNLISQRIEIGPGQPLDQPQLLGVRQPA